MITTYTEVTAKKNHIQITYNGARYNIREISYGGSDHCMSLSPQQFKDLLEVANELKEALESNKAKT